MYQRAKGAVDTRALGTRRNAYAEGFEWANHSMFPLAPSAVEDRVTIGGPSCLRPYSASLLNVSAMSFGALSAAQGHKRVPRWHFNSSGSRAIVSENAFTRRDLEER